MTKSISCADGGSDCGWQIEKTILMLAKLTANQTKQAHPEIDTSNLEEVVKELMRDEFVD